MSQVPKVPIPSIGTSHTDSLDTMLVQFHDRAQVSIPLTRPHESRWKRDTVL